MIVKFVVKAYIEKYRIKLIKFKNNLSFINSKLKIAYLALSYS